MRKPPKKLFRAVRKIRKSLRKLRKQMRYFTDAPAIGWKEMQKLLPVQDE